MLNTTEALNLLLIKVMYGKRAPPQRAFFNSSFKRARRDDTPHGQRQPQKERPPERNVIIRTGTLPRYTIIAVTTQNATAVRLQPDPYEDTPPFVALNEATRVHVRNNDGTTSVTAFDLKVGGIHWSEVYECSRVPDMLSR